MAGKNKHPKALPVLFFTEMWERFGFYLMLGIFMLYMTDSTETGGMGLGTGEAADIFGTYLALVYLTPFVGGLLAERHLGFRKSIFAGGALMAVGYIGLAVPGKTAFFLSLGLIILGNGLFKPNISALLGKLYDDEQYRANKDAGYNIFYMGINVGAFLCNFVAAVVRNQFGWGYAFATAGVGMIVGLVWFAFGQKYTAEADIVAPPRKEEMPTGKLLGIIFGPALAFGVLGWFGPTAVLGHPIVGSQSNDAFLLASLPVVGYYLSLWLKAPEKEKAPIAALLSIMGVVVVFWAVFHQNGTALTLFARDYTDREMPAAMASPAEALYLEETVDTTPREVPLKDAHGVIQKDEAGEPITELGPDPYFNNIPETEHPPPDEEVSLISTELFQSVNPGWIILLTPLVVGFFNWLGQRGKEPSTPAKIALGLFITGLSTLVMVAAVKAGANGADKVSPLWLVGSYAVVTVGELCLSPMGLSLVSKLSPRRITAIMMGGWFLSTAIGNKLSGALASMWDTFDNKANFFLMNFGFCVVAALAIVALLPWLKRVMKDID